MGWTKVCETARSEIWLLKGNARARMLPANLDHLRVEWPYQYGRGAAVRPHTGSHPLGVPGGMCNGTEPEPVFRFRIIHPLAQR